MTRAAAPTIRQGGIIAAGAGSRLREDGCRVSKPMVPVAGRPLIAHALGRFRAAGIRRLTVIINEESDDCRQWLNRHAGDFDLDLIRRTTASSFASFRLVADRLSGAPAVITTVDAVMPDEDFCDFVDAVANLAREGVVLGLSHQRNDDNPLWATLDPSGGRIRRLGGNRGSHVTAGLYGLPADRPGDPATGFDQLRAYLRWLVEAGYPVHGVVLPCVFDIDRMRDAAAAERAAAAGGRRGQRP